MIKSSSVRHFHFLDFSEKRHSDVRAESSNFLAMVERSQVGFSEDEKPFSNTQFASFCHWVEGLASVQDFPLYFPCRGSGFAIPDVCAQDSFMFIIFIVERLFMVSESCLEFGGAPHVLLHLHLPVHLGLLHLRQVNHVGGQALALEGASISLLLPLGIAVTAGIS